MKKPFENIVRKRRKGKLCILECAYMLTWQANEFIEVIVSQPLVDQGKSLLFKAVFDIISVISQHPVHLSML